MKNIRIALTLILTSVSILAFGQRASVKGKVKDAENQGILGASVLLRPTVKGDISDADGTYQIENIKAGTYIVEVSFLGFENYKREITLAEGQALALDIELIESPYTLQDVEIVGRIPTEYLPEITYAGTKTGARIKDIPQSIAVLNKEILSDQQIFRISEISDNVAGINLFRPETFTSRGFNVRQDYVNGNRVVLTPDFANPSVTSHYERVEVIKGPAAALFGNSSPGGVINAVTKKPLTTNRASASFTAGSFNTQRATADLTGPLNEKKTLLYRFNVAWEDAESYRDFIHNKNLLVAPSISYLPDDKTRINIDLVNSQSNDIAGVDRGMPVLQGDLFALPISFNSAELFDNRQNTSTLLTISGSRQLTDGISVNVSYSITDFNQNFIETRSSNRFTDDGTELVRNVNDRITNVDSDFVTAYLVAKANTGKVNHEFVLGYDYFNTFQSSTNRSANGEVQGVPNLVFSDRQVFSDLSQLLVEFSPVASNFSLSNGYNAFYIQDLLSVGERLKVLLGLRYEDLQQENLLASAGDLSEQIDNTVFLPRVGATYALNDAVNLFVSYSQSFNQQVVPGAVNSIDPDETFGPLESESFEFGTKTSLFNNRLLAQLSFYIINQTGRLTEDPSSNGALIQMIQLGDETSRGVEVDMTGRIGTQLSLNVNYAYNDLEIEDDRSEIAALSLESNNPQHTAGVWGKYTIANGFFENFSFGLGARYVSQSQTIDTAPNIIDPIIVFPEYFTAKASLYYQLEKVSFSVIVNNIFDERYFIGGLNSGRVFPGAPRNFLATVNYTF